MATEPLPIFVDLDGTLILGDLSIESLLTTIKNNPFLIFAIVLWWIKGKATLKRKLSTSIDPKVLPYNRPLLDYLKEKAKAGTPVFLATASDENLARAVARHLGLFQGVLASDGVVNLSGKNKKVAILQKTDNGPFIYAGDAWRDLPIWAAAEEAIVVNPTKLLERRIAKSVNAVRIFQPRPSRLRMVLRTLRLHHWSKNLLVFVPIFTAHQFSDVHRLVHTWIAFLAFGFVCSAGYVFNDLLDLDSDRQHQTKRCRPLPSGALSLTTGMAMVPACLGVGFGLACVVPAPFSVALFLYMVTTFSYSLFLKRLPVVDVLVLAALFTLRIFSGGFAAEVPISQWLIAFSGFLFVSLALLKRYAELRNLKAQAKKSPPGRGYSVEDLELLAVMGLATGCTAVLILAFYINSSDISALYTRPELLWFFCPFFFYWLFRMWLMGRRGEMTEDPIVFATRDISSWIIGILVVATMLFAM